MSVTLSHKTQDDEAAALEAAVDQVLATCDGDPRAAVRALLVALELHETELQSLRDEIACLTAAVSRGYARGRVRRNSKS